MTFDQWLAEFDRIALADGCTFSDGRTYSQATGAECFQETFDEGLTPAEAWSEEKAAAF